MKRQPSGKFGPKARAEGGFTLPEIVVSLAILAMISAGVAGMIAQTQKVDTLMRERLFVQSSLLTRVQELRTLPEDQIRGLDGSSFAFTTASPVTQPAPGAPTGTGPTFGDVLITPTTGQLSVVEVNPNAPATPSPGSGYFAVTATSTWVGMLGPSSPQTITVTTYVVSHAN